MYGFTIVLRRKNKYSRAVRRSENEKNKPEMRVRRRTRQNKKRTFPIKPGKILPLIFIVAAVLVGAVLPKNEKSESVEEVVGMGKKAINYFELPDDDYSFYYAPLVINGIDSYSENESVSDEMIASCCWSLISDKDAPEKYERDDEKTVIPSEDVEKRFKEIFGARKGFEHRSVNINGCAFDFSDNKYIIEITGMTPTFLPKLLKLESEYGKITLNIGCLKNDEYVQDKDGNTVEPKPSKRLKFILTDDGDGLHVKSVETV